MPKQYDKQTVLAQCDAAMQTPSLFYTRQLVKYLGICPDAQVPYTEIIAEYLIEHLAAYTAGFSTLRRDGSYYPGHLGNYDPHSSRIEEITAMKLFNHCKAGGQYAKIGRVLEYQVPLKNKRSDQAGKIDLLAWDGHVLRILELKKPGVEKETMLRCVLEGDAYLRTVDTAKLIANFNQGIPDLHLPEDTPVKASPFVFENSRPERDYHSECPQLKKLMALLDSEPFFLREVPGGYEVF